MCQVLFVQLVKEEIKMSKELNMTGVLGFFENNCDEYQTTTSRKSK